MIQLPHEPPGTFRALSYHVKSLRLPCYKENPVYREAICRCSSRQSQLRFQEAHVQKKSWSEDQKIEAFSRKD